MPPPLERMPMRMGGNWRKRWRYVGAYDERFMLCAAAVEIGPGRETFWALWDREERALRERTRHVIPLLAGPEVSFGPSSVSVRSREVEIDLELGDNSISYSGVENLEGQETETIITLVQADTYLYFVVAAGGGEDIQAIAVDFTNGLIERDGSGAGEFNEDGTSTGGLWDKYPVADDELVSDLLPFDQMLFPVPESTPES